MRTYVCYVFNSHAFCDNTIFLGKGRNMNLVRRHASYPHHLPYQSCTYSQKNRNSINSRDIDLQIIPACYIHINVIFRTVRPVQREIGRALYANSPRLGHENCCYRYPEFLSSFGKLFSCDCNGIRDGNKSKRITGLDVCCVRL